MKYDKERSENVNLVTSYTFSLLKTELEHAQNDFKDSLMAIGVAGDWHDNAVFDHATIKNDVDASRLITLQEKLRNIQLIEPKKSTIKIDIGNLVVVRFEGEDDDEQFTILGPDDSRRKSGWISYTSPLGESLIGKKKGETATFTVNDNGHDINLQARIVKILPGNF